MQVDPRFRAVEDAFRANVDDGELGAACTVIVDDRVVVDLWGGWADVARTRPWQRDTLVNTYSVGKPLVATAVLQLGLDLDAPARRWWPELATPATVRQVLSHQAGVPAIRQRLTNDDLWSWETMTAAVAATEPWWEPGSGRHAYHTNTYGHLVGGLFHRVTDRRPGDWLRSLGVDLAWGLTPEEQARCADVDWRGPAPGGPPDAAAVEALPDGQRMVLLGYVNPPGYSSMGVVNSAEWRAAQVPSTNLHATAGGVAGFYARVLAGDLLPADLLAEATRTQSEGWCPVLEREASFGLGFQPTRPDRPFGPNPGSYGHFGTGGALGFADPVARVAFGYVMNAVVPRWQNSRNRALVDAVYACL